MPGQFIPGADSHSRAYGAYGAVGMGVGSTTLGFGWATGYIYFTLVRARRVVFDGSAAALGRRQGHRAGAAAALGREAVAGDVGGAGRRERAAADCLSQHDRQHDGRGRGAERHLRAGRHHLRLVPRQGHQRPAVSALCPGSERRLRNRRDDRSDRRDVDDRQAVQSGQRVPRRRSGRGASHVRQGDDRILHERQLRRSAVGRARHPRGATTAAPRRRRKSS